MFLNEIVSRIEGPTTNQHPTLLDNLFLTQRMNNMSRVN